MVARGILSLPITIVSSESTFSTSSGILTERRVSVLIKTMKIFVTTRNWLYVHGST